MCGIAGIFSGSAVEKSDLKAITDALNHRGPDAQGLFLEDAIGLGHNRLSIIDLDARSHQPFHSACGRYVIVFNGEIYNYKTIATELTNTGASLRTTSDTEVLLEAFITWGTGFVHKLNGMFAFAIFDRMQRKLFLYRDRIGKKPLYYFHQKGIFIFASELKALLAYPALRKKLNVNKKSVAAFLQLGYIPQPDTFFENVHKFPAGHYGIVDQHLSLSLFSYWNVSHYITTHRHTTEASALNQLREIVTDAVSSRLVADVPVGIFLSGGIDSSLVAAVASQSNSIKTFSIGFREQQFDESIHAERVAKHLNSFHHRYVLSQQEGAELVEKYLDHFDEPFADTSAIPTMLVSRLARQEVKVALTGDGGDELFLGYGAYTWANRLANPFWSPLRPVIHNVMMEIPSVRWKRASHMFEKVRKGKQRRHIFSQEQYLFSEQEVKHKLLKDDRYYSDWEYDDFRYLSILSEAERQALFDFQFYLRDDLLVKVDRASMLYGLECRCPLLDYRLAEFAVNLPERYRKQRFTTKYLLKKMLFELVPSHYFDRPKRGFGIPLAQWLKSDLSYLMEYLSDTNLERTNVFDIAYVQSLKHRFHKGETYLYNRLWAVIIAQRFLINYGS